jgi:AcrR family transcriptional regulator
VSDNPVIGLRERKKQRTRDSIQREAMRLFRQRGYEATTIEQIAEAVEISPSTFFNYFPTKEDVVFHDEMDPAVAAAFLARPPGEPLGVALRQTMAQVSGQVLADRNIQLERARLIFEVPALRSRLWQELERSQEFIRALIAERTGRDPGDFEMRVVVGVVVGALFEAAFEWIRRGARDDLEELCNRALDVVEAGARLDQLEGRSPGE